LTDIICTFLTRKAGKPLTFGLLIDQRGGPDHPPEGLRTLALMANRHPGACAYGKIVLLRDSGLYTFQAMANGDTLPAWCGNSTAAALCRLGDDGAVRTRVYGESARACTVSAQVRAEEVSQRWIVPADPPTERRWRGRRVLCLGTLNSYAIVQGGLPAGVSPETARRELTGAGKLAVIGGVEDKAVVRFYNANGRHGAVPQTGAASIALAMRHSAWLRDCFPGGRLTYLNGEGTKTAELPPVSQVSEGSVAIEMPTTEVVLSPLAMELVA
jgi:hypothetical protein